jgi:hypothetical protein
MADGQTVHVGAAAMNGVPFGTRVQILSGPLAGALVVIEDRIGHGSDLDITMPWNCAGALLYGRQRIAVALG